MSDYCKACSNKVKDKTGADACPFNMMNRHFRDRQRERSNGNPRMGNMYRVWDRMSEDKRETVLKDAAAFLGKMDAGETI